MRTLIVSNRLPVTVQEQNGQTRLVPSSGGLATALRSLQRRSAGSWIGWPGDVSSVSEGDRAALHRELGELGTAPVYLSQTEVSRYYDRFSNGVLWPLCHYLLDRVRVDAQRDWVAYRDVNARFASAVVEQWRPGDLVWVHDYQLALVPGLIRALEPRARVGFFLHIPFPASDVFRILPWRAELLQGLLGADLVGFQTSADADHFARTVAAVLGLEAERGGVLVGGRCVRFGAYPIGVDVAEIGRTARSEVVERELLRLRELAPGKLIVLGVDRLDYTKGVLRRISAIERLLEREPALREKLHFIQLAVPSREHVDGYVQYRRSVNELVSKVNGRFGTGMSVPIHLLHRGVSVEDLTALYRAADVMLVTPLRDGMNLVAKEYVAARVDERGVLVLSEFAGAARELGEALQVNPYDLEAMATTIERALAMSPVEQQRRMRALRARVSSKDVHAWASEFVSDLAGEPSPSTSLVEDAAEATLERSVAALRASRHLELLLDYDGTLVPFASLPPANRRSRMLTGRQRWWPAGRRSSASAASSFSRTRAPTLSTPAPA